MRGIISRRPTSVNDSSYNVLMKGQINSYMYMYMFFRCPIDITNGNYSQYNPAIAIDSSNNTHIVWEGYSSTSPSCTQIRYAKSTDRGNTWSNPVNITSGAYEQYTPSIAIDSSNNIHIVWSGESSTTPTYHQIRYTKSTDGGNTWNIPVNITSEYYEQFDPSIAIDSFNNIHIVWVGYTPDSPWRRQVRYAKSIGGNTWSSPIDITSEDYSQYVPTIGIDSSNNIHIVWEGYSSASPSCTQIRYAKSTDRGNTWSSPIDITSEDYSHFNPLMDIDSSNNIHIVWYGCSPASPNYTQIRYAKSIGGGNTWSIPADITSEDYSQYDPTIGIDSSNNIRIVWYGYSSASPNYTQIRYAKSIGGGNTWSSPIDITSEDYSQYDPTIGIDSSNNIHIVWGGNSPASPNYCQIRYCRKS